MLIAIGIMLTVIYSLVKLHNEDYSVRIAYGISFLGIWIYAVTEILSIPDKMNRTVCTATWIIYDFIFLTLLLVHIARHFKKINCHRTIGYYKLHFYEIAGIVALMIYGTFICYLSIRIVPYNWDSMSYHLSRIWFWVQQESVKHFITMDTRMLGTPAFTEFVDLHLYLLYGQYNDSVLNLPQSFSYILNIFLVYSITRRIGCKFRNGIFAAILFASTPIAFAESLSTQTDEFAALWILIFTRVLLELVYCEGKLLLNAGGIFRLCVLSVSLALSILTKPSGMFCIAVLFLWLLFICVKRKDSIALISKWILSAAVLMTIIIVPEALRNLMTYNAITDPWQGPGQLVLTLDMRYHLVNFFKNIGFFIPGVLWPEFNQIWQHIVYYLGYILHVNVDSELISEGGSYQDNLIGKSENYGFDTATNSVITLLFLVISIYEIIKIIHFLIRRITKNSNTNCVFPIEFGYSTAAFTAFILTCACVKSEIFVCRYMIATFGLLSPAICLQLEKLSKKAIVSSTEKESHLSEGIIYGAAGLLICSQFINMVVTHSKHIYSGGERAEAYYESNIGEYDTVYKELEQYIEVYTQEQGIAYKNIGLIMESNTYVYPVLRLLENHSDTVKYIAVSNDSSRYLDNAYIPDCIIVISYADMGDAYSNGYEYNGINYIEEKQLSERCRVLVR